MKVNAVAAPDILRELRMNQGMAKRGGLASRLLFKGYQALAKKEALMRQDMAEHECSRETSTRQDTAETPRALTYDEAKAAEAAFRGEPFNPAWSAAAAQVYAGLSKAMQEKQALMESSETTAEQEPEYISG
jgi:hypothetical protein